MSNLLEIGFKFLRYSLINLMNSIALGDNIQGDLGHKCVNPLVAKATFVRGTSRKRCLKTFESFWGVL